MCQALPTGLDGVVDVERVLLRSCGDAEDIAPTANVRGKATMLAMDNA